MGIHIIVCIKSVVLDAPGGKIVRTPDTTALNPFDLPALETALALSDELGGMVTALSMGPEISGLSLYSALSMGVDRGVLLCDKALAGADTLATSNALCAGLKLLEPYDLVLFGTRTADSDTGQVGPQTAVGAGLPLVAQARDILVKGKSLEVSAECDGFRQRFEVETPCALTVAPEAAKARNASLGGIEEAFSGEIEVWSLEKLGLTPDQVGDAGSPTKIKDMTPAAKGKQCAFLTGSIEEQADKLLEKLVNAGLIQ
ncbi:Electron transfer flavoprotein (Etf), beta-subunit [Desulfatibacillum aliphaticivorans]|uniref:Electron transfer flavoprotein (Etf), beta-subunit n=1 Tax=Desulfatibacillum aliphaticivorans TaxID=218208 RepID=B8FE70_DESAL|nr:electron transfer flavoprotein subunit beta/FixA family protein [Desulfatibacillum aliphaticivorans]ACL06851.1 Electron transfer flavoprotein (Etf), beta-subunit [Desulfatibacillum aliphaticivorans]